MNSRRNHAASAPKFKLNRTKAKKLIAPRCSELLAEVLYSAQGERMNAILSSGMWTRLIDSDVIRSGTEGEKKLAQRPAGKWANAR